MDGASGSRTPDVVGQGERGVANLSFVADLASQLLEDLHHLSRSGRPEWMPFRFQSTTRVDGGVPLVDGASSLSGKTTACASRSEAKVLGGKNFGDGETVVNLSNVDVVGLNAGHVVGLRTGLLRGSELRD